MPADALTFEQLAALNIPHSLPVIMAMLEMANHFPRPINGRFAKVPLWDRAAVENWYRENLAPNRRRERIGTERWWDA
jgi:hypothetical protein